MSTVSRAAATTVQLRKWTCEQYEHLIELGVFDPDEPETERRRTAPEEGSAAERAAARRARLRENREKGNS